MKLIKKLTFILLAVCMAFSSFALSACDPTDNPTPNPPIVEDLGKPENDGYQFTVKYPDGTPVKGSDTGSSRKHVCVVLLDDNGTRITEPNDGIIDEFGVAKLNFKIPGEYNVSIINIPAGYVFNPIKTSATVSKHNISLDNLTTAYPVELTYADGTPAKNIPVKFIDDNKEGAVVASLTTGEDGKATSEKIIAGKYSVILEIPENQGYLPVKTTMSGDTVKAEIFDINLLQFEDKDKLDEAGMNKWDAKLNGLTTPFDMNAEYYEYVAHATKGKPAYYAIYANKKGTYNFHVWADSSKKYEVLFYGMNFETVHSDLTISTDTNANRPLDLDANNIYYFAISTTSENLDLTFALSAAVPKPTTTEWRNELGTKEITFDMNEAIIHFIPKEAGIYEVTSISDYDTFLMEYGTNGEPLEQGTNPDYYDDDSGAGKNFKYTTTITKSYVGGTFNYHINIKDANIEYPTKIQISIIKVGEAPNEKQFITRKASATAKVKFSDQDGVFKWMPLDGSLETYQNSNGIWYVKLADGTERPLVIAITKNIRNMEYSFSDVEYKGDSSATPEGPSTNPDSPNDPNENTPKNTMLTVAENLDEYLDKDAPTATLINYRDFIKTYATLVNRDGIYELNGELKIFVERYMNQRGKDITSFNNPPLEVADGCMWLLGCGYYE